MCVLVLSVGMIFLTYLIEETAAGHIQISPVLDEKNRTPKETVFLNHLAPAMQALLDEAMVIGGTGLTLEKSGLSERAKRIAREHLGER